jgi:protein involved in polysaccharide export with SLBB domain
MRRFTRSALALLFALATVTQATAQNRTTNPNGNGNSNNNSGNSSGADSAPVPAMNLSLSPSDGGQQNGSQNAAQGNASMNAGDTAVPEVSLQAMPTADYAANAKSDVFGANLFTGSFARGGATQFNPDYLIAAGDRIQVRIWGGFTFDGILMVDPQGNVFLPQVGPVRLAGVRNANLQQVLESAMRRVFRANVFGYASLAAAQPVRIFVGGFVNRPGQYNGTSTASLLQYLDQAGGIDPERGTFLDVQVKRGDQVRAHVNLYDFLLGGRIPQVQLSDGDVIFVGPRQNVVKVAGLAANAKRFEFAGPSISIADLSRMARPQAAATNVRVVRNTGTVRDTNYYALGASVDVTVGNGDDVVYTADKKPGSITVRVEGETLSPQEYVLPYGSSIGALMAQIKLSPRSDIAGIQLYRASVVERQRAMLATSLTRLESAVLTARSGTSDEARLRKDEADLILQWVSRARTIEPSGQVLIAQAVTLDALPLENGDLIRVPAKDGLVLVSGEVLFPNAIAYDTRLTLDDYIARAGGYTQNAENSRVIVAHRDGSFADSDAKAAVRAGDQVLVLPKIDVKSRQVWKDLTQIIYQIAVSAKVVLGL